MRGLEVLEEEIQNSDECIVSQEDIQEYIDAGINVEFIRRVDKPSREFADCEQIEYKGSRLYEEYRINGNSLYVAVE